MSGAVDVNCDLGEGLGTAIDFAMLRLVSSANVATGGHAGDVETMRTVCAGAARLAVAIGAHVSYQDREHFGRRMLAPPPAELQAELESQLLLLRAVAADAGARVAYVKPHGALYNTIAHDEEQARVVVAAMRAVDPALPILGLAGSRGLEIAAAAGVRTFTEAFADRGYTSTGALVPRGEPGAVLHDVDLVAERVVRLVETGEILSADGQPVRVAADSICVHSDTPDAIALAAGLRDALDRAGIAVRPFAAAPAA
ncbi:5-oxoprolinase subunit PxpA [Agromyces seonyuensis]|uniref:5-oxoprolinase subunit PxpA n=1 Tax=Agromyces seonyuensis TaxID=2662446 RepID=A0A6I4P605_9MICO|nr:5-oxoprolinase subunit PxpA [Agromyces seonyuensis]